MGSIGGSSGRCLPAVAGATLDRLAAETALTASTLSRLETGKLRPTLEQLLPLARAHGVPLDDLVQAPPTGAPPHPPAPGTPPRAGVRPAEHGYDNATLESIGARVGTPKGSVYNYVVHNDVGSKEDLLLAVVDQPAQALLAEFDRLRADTDGSVAMRLRELIRTQVRIFSDYHPAAFVYLQHVGRFRSPVFARFDDMDRRYIAAVESLPAEGVDKGEFSLAGSPAVAARAVVGMFDWMQHWFTPQSGEADARLADELFAIALGGLLTAGGVHSLTRGLPHEAPPQP